MDKKHVLQIFMFAFVSITILPITNVTADSTTIYVNPPLRIVQKIGETCQINISVSQVTDLAGWDFKLYYPSAKLNATEIAEGPFLKTAGSTFFIIKNFTDSYNATHGTIWAACTLIGSGPGASGDGTLATIAFRTKILGDASLHLAETDLIDSKMPPNRISHTSQDGLIYIRVHDVAVTSVTLSKTVVGRGYSMGINVTVKNQGNYTETFNVTTYANIPAMQTKTITLTSGNSTTITFTWNTTGVPYDNYIIAATATQVQYETETTDNTKTDGLVLVTVVGDVNGDGIVDGADMGTVGIALWSKLGEPLYNPNADVNCDGSIDGADQGTVGIHLWESWP